MVTLLFTSVFVVAALAIAIYFWQKPTNTSQPVDWSLPPQEPHGLFSDFRVNELRPPTAAQLEDKATKVDRETDAETFHEAIKAIRDWQQSPNRHSAAKLLHVAALSDDAKNYSRAIELVLMSWRDGGLSDISAPELQTLINSEYWVLSSRTRTSGAGFVLKETLASAIRELESPNNTIQPSTASS